MSVSDLVTLPDDAPMQRIQELLDAIGEEHINDSEGVYTPLLWAITTNIPEIVRAVLDKGADPNYEDTTLMVRASLLPLSWCIYNSSNPEIVDMLLRRGANPNGIVISNEHQNFEGTTLLNYAVKFSRHDIVVRLVEAGGNVNFLDSLGRTVLDNANRRLSILEDRNDADDALRIRDFLVASGARAATAAERAAAAEIAAAPVRGVAFEIHNAFDKINKERLIQFMEREIPGGLALFAAAPTNPAFGAFVIESMKNLHTELPSNSNANRTSKQQALVNLNAFSERLRLVDYDIQTRKIIFYTIQFLSRQSPEFKNTYIKNFTYDCAQAYESGNGVSCTKGIMERIVTTLTPASLLHVGEPVYDELVSILNPKLLKKIFAEVGSECNDRTTKEEFRACVHERIRQRYEMQGTPYNATTTTAINAELNTYIPDLGLYDGGARKKSRQTRRGKSKAKKTRGCRTGLRASRRTGLRASRRTCRR